MVENLGNNNTLLDQYIAEIRDAEIQKDSSRFRKNLERIGEIFAYEISKKLEYEKKEVNTTLGVAEVPMLKYNPVLVTLLRAGLPIQQGLLNFFDRSENGFVSVFRKSNKEEEFTLHIEYVSCPDISGKILILSDAMIATGESVVNALKEIFSNGEPLHTHIVTVLASEEGIERIKKSFSKTAMTLWVGAIDHEITARALLVPGLGDAGDLAFGAKSKLSTDEGSGN